jgi:outer membrane protein assembly factor BamB
VIRGATWSAALGLGLLALALAGCAPAVARDAATGLGPPRVAGGALEFHWSRPLIDHRDEYHPVEYASPVVVERPGRTLVVTGGFAGVLAAFDARQGEPVWRRKLAPMSSRPLVLPDGVKTQLIVGTDAGALLAIDADDGKELWRAETKGAVGQPPTPAGELLIAANDADRVVAVERKTGKIRWQYERETPEEFTVRGHAGVGVAKDRVYAGFADGNLVALDLRSGEVVWTHSLAGSETKFIDVDVTPVVADGVVYTASVAGGVYAIDATTGAERWRTPLFNAATLTKDGDRLFVGAAEHGITCLDLEGHVIWQEGMAKAGDPGTPIVLDDVLIFSTANNGLYIVRKRDGSLIQSWNPGAGIGGDPAIERSASGKNALLYVLSNGGILYAFGLFPEPPPEARWRNRFTAASR